MRVMVKFRKEEPARYVSHLDLMKAMQRALRRADIPIAYSEGFHPHPVMAFASALPVGATSEAEYMDIELSRTMEPSLLTDRLGAASGDGLRPVGAWELPSRMPSLMALVDRARWSIPFAELSEEALREGAARLLRAETIVLEKHGKKGSRMMDIRPGIHELSVDTGTGIPVLEALLDAGSTGNVQPALLAGALLEHAEAETVPGLHRLELLTKTEHGWAPLECVAVGGEYGQ